MQTLICLLGKFVKCSPDVKCYLFKTCCCNLYCAPFWYDSTKKNLKIAYNNSLRRPLRLPSHNSASDMFANLNNPSFRELFRNYVYSFRDRLETSDNIIIHGIYLSQFYFYLVFGFDGVIFCRRNYTMVLCIILYFYFLLFFFNINLHDLCIICKIFIWTMFPK